jgi:hypothetical protein
MNFLKISLLLSLAPLSLYAGSCCDKGKEMQHEQCENDAQCVDDIGISSLFTAEDVCTKKRVVITIDAATVPA